jgi:hypothetical protein
MRFFRLHIAALATIGSLFFLLGGILVGIGGTPAARGQSLVAGDIAGTVTDPSGAAVVGAKLTATNKETGAIATTTTSTTGAYRFSLLKPGPYELTASAAGFKMASTNVTVAIGQIVMQNIGLALGAASETIEVSATSQLLQTDTAEMSTELSLEQLENIPNPGSDITYAAQAKPGVIMNSEAGTSTGLTGYGNFSAFGLPGTSNNFTVNGMQVNDPFLNLNNSGPSNLLLGLNDIQETNVVMNAYEVQYGSFGGVQLNSVSRSGSDKFHGNLVYSWNGRSLNANDTFNKNVNYVGTTPSGAVNVLARPFSNFNQWAGSVGGPILKNKLFFFFNTEGISFITSSQSVVYLPDPSFQSSVVGTNAKCSDSTSSLYNNGFPGECAFYNSVFALYNGTPNISHAVENPSLPGQLELSVPSKFNLTEKMYTGRVDTNLTASDKAFGHFKYDNGVQPSYTDPINSAFDADSKQPDYEGQFAETHTFGTRAANVFLMTGSYYSAIFVNKDPSKELSTFPMDLRWYDGFASDLNELAYAWPEGRNVAQYQFGDDFSYTVGKHTLKAGVAFKKDDLSDADTGILTTPLVFTDATLLSPTGSAFDSDNPSDFQLGQSLLGVQNFTTNLDLPLSLYTLGFYVQDQWKPIAKATVTAGIRVERNSNVSCPKNCLSNFGGDFFTLAKSAPLNSFSGAYNQQIKSGLNTAFTSYQPYMIEPRVGFTWSPDSKTVLRGGFGIFTDVFPGTIADTMLDNPPLTLEFQILGAAFGGPTMPLQPTASGSYQQQAAGANTTFQSQFKTGGSANSMLIANPNYSVPSFTTVEAKLHYPTYNEWNLQIQRQLSRSESVQVGYVGTRGYHEPVENVGVNATGGYGLPAATPPAPSFGPVTEVDSSAVSNYNGLIASYVFQGHGLTAQFNYEWSHALDEISNGGILPFDSASIMYQDNPHNLRDQYGNSDYDSRHYFSGNYLYEMPHFGGPKALTGGWQIGGTVYFNSGSPFTPTAYVSDWGITNFGNGENVAPVAPLPGAQVAHHCGPSASNPNTPCLTTSEFATTSTTASSIPFGAYEKNQFYGPRYFDTDATLLKAFALPHTSEQAKLEVGLTAFNLLNHPNFGLLNANTDAANFGITTVAVGPPTSIYGAGLGGDPSVRIVELNARFIF